MSKYSEEEQALIDELEEAMRWHSVEDPLTRAVAANLGVPLEYLSGGSKESATVAVRLQVFERQMKEHREYMEKVAREFCLQVLQKDKP